MIVRDTETALGEFVVVEMTKEEAEQLLAATMSDLAQRWVDFERWQAMKCWDCSTILGKFVEALKKAGLKEGCQTEEAART